MIVRSRYLYRNATEMLYRNCWNLFFKKKPNTKLTAFTRQPSRVVKHEPFLATDDSFDGLRIGYRWRMGIGGGGPSGRRCNQERNGSSAKNHRHKHRFHGHNVIFGRLDLVMWRARGVDEKEIMRIYERGNFSNSNQNSTWQHLYLHAIKALPENDALFVRRDSVAPVRQDLPKTTIQQSSCSHSSTIHRRAR